MAIEEHIEYLSDFEKAYDSSLPIAFRAGAEGSATKTRHAILLNNQPITIYNVRSQTKKEITKEQLLEGKISDLLKTLVTNVYWNMRFQEASMKSEPYLGPNEITLFEVTEDKIASLNTAYDRCKDHEEGKKIKMLVTKKQARVAFDEPVKDNMGLLTYTLDGVKKGSMYIIDMVLEKDSSGGYKSNK